MKKPITMKNLPTGMKSNTIAMQNPVFVPEFPYGIVQNDLLSLQVPPLQS
jgi:hypothetical protein